MRLKILFPSNESAAEVDRRGNGAHVKLLACGYGGVRGRGARVRRLSVSLQPGERALVFLNAQPSGRVYQRYWRGHFSLVDLNGILHAVAHWDILAGDKQWYPSALYDAAIRPNRDKPWEVALPWDALERQLEREIAIRDADE